LIDLELIEEVKRNNKQAFRSLFINYREKVTSTAYLILKDHHLVEDIVQETFLQVSQKINTLSDPTRFEGWLYKITVNLCFQTLRKLRKVTASSLEEYTASGFDVNIEACTPEDIFIAKDTKVKMLHSIYSLPTKYTVVIILYYYNNLSVKEIADIIKESESNVKARLFRARKLLEKSLIQDDVVIFHNLEGGSFYERR
jgi:RNA polymerase sigma-70 factor (ECF subfamily)